MDRIVDAARTRFLRGGASLLGEGDVRPVVLASWERSVAAGVDLERLAAAFVGHAGDGPWTGAAEAVLGGFAADAAGTRAVVGLVDGEGVVRVRHDLDPVLGELLDATRWVPGYRHAEAVVGTTAAGVALHERTPVLLEGTEHLHPELRGLRGAAVPLDERGVVVVLTHAGEPDATSLALARTLAHQVAGYERAARHRRVLAAHDAVHDAGERGACWVLASVEDDDRIGRGVHRLDPADRQALHDALTASVLLDETGEHRHLDLPSGGCASVSVQEIRADGAVVGSVLAGRPVDRHTVTARDSEARRRQGSHVAPTARRDFAADLQRRAGATREEDARVRASQELFSPYTRARHEVAANLGHRRPQLLVGEAGVGKRALAVEWFGRLHPRGRVTTIDCASLDHRATPAEALRPAPGEHLVLLRRLQALTPVTARRLDEALRPVLDDAILLGALDGVALDAGRPYGLLLRHFHETVRVPALRHRTDELADIAASVLRSLAGARSLRLSHQVVRVLEGYAWPGNISELEDVLRYVVARKPVGVIQAPDLPALCFTSRAPRLSMLETAQADAIIHALYEARGNRYKAAAMLGIARSSLYRKIDAFGISYIA